MKINGIIFAGDYYVEHVQSGIDTLGFEIHPTDNAYSSCIQGAVVSDDRRNYKIKEIDDSGNSLFVTCVIDLDELKTSFIYRELNEAKTLEYSLKHYLPDTWGVIGKLRGDLRTFEVKRVNPFNVLLQLQRVYSCHFVYDNVKKTVTVIYPDEIEYKGDYLSNQLNTITSQYTSDSYSLANRIYAYGKDGLTMADANNGSEYVENLTFQSIPISECVVDEKLTKPEEILELARYTLNQRCKSKESYKFKIINLSKLDKNDFSLKNLAVHTLVKYLDKERKKEVFHIVTKYREYPLHPEKDEITLSSEVTNISSSVAGSVTAINQNIENSAVKAFNDASKYTDDSLAPIKSEMSLLKSRLNGYTGSVSTPGGTLYFENGVLKRVG